MCVLCVVLMLEFQRPATSANPQVLKGRIEEVTGPGEARLPEFKTMTPKLDTRNQQGTNKQTGTSGATVSTEKAALQAQTSYPINWEGDWRGQLQIMAAKYLEPTPAALRDEIETERRVNTPGRAGKSVFRFRRMPLNKVSLDPVRVEFSYPRNMKMPEPIEITNQNASRFLKHGETLEEGMTLVPTRSYFIEMNNVDSGITLGGNLVSQKVMRNDVRALAPKVIEQDIVTYSVEEMHDTNQNYASYNEDVLRFTMLNERTILVQAVTLSYDSHGKCDSSLSLAGYIYR